jgi:uncharacterized protein (TIGR02246 family)
MPTESPADSTAADLDSARAAFAAAIQIGDAEGAAAAYAEDATLVAPAAEVLQGRAAIERFWRTGVETGVQRVELSVVAVQRRGEIAMEVGRYELHVTADAGGTVVDRGRYLVLHRTDGDGRWRRCAEMFSPDRPPTREPS